NPRSERARRALIIGCRHSIQVQTASGMETLSAPDSAVFTDLSAGFRDGAAIIYGTTNKDAFVSSNGGATWDKCILPGTGARVRAVATSLHHPDTAYLSYNQLQLNGEKWEGVAK